MAPLKTARTLPVTIRRLLRERIATNLDLPMQSTTAARVVALCQDEDRDVREFTEVVQHDPSLAGHILSVANSAAYAAREPITSLHQAVNWLGISTLSEIAIAVSLKGKVFDVPGYATRLRELWIHSAATAVFARELSQRRVEDADGMFLCGLLHNVGKPVVMQNLADMARQKTEVPVPKGIMELAMDEYHEEVGGMLVAHWDFPDWMERVVRWHGDPEKAEEHADRARIVRIACRLGTWALSEESTPEDFDLEQAEIQELGIQAPEMRRLLDRRGEVLEVADAFL